MNLILVFLIVVSCAGKEDLKPQRWIREDPEESFSIDRLAAGLSPSELRELTSRPLKVTLGHAQRNAVLAVSGDSFARTVRIPPDGQMRLEYGVVCPGESAFQQLAPVELQVLLQRADHDPEILWETRLKGDDPDRARRWNEAVIDLSRHGGHEARIAIRPTTARGSVDAPPCLIAFGNPEVTSRASERRALNVILISVDTLRADRLSLYGYARNTTPHIDAWARERAMVFATAVAQANWTLPSHVSMLTGLDALNHGVNFNPPAPPTLDSVAELFRRAGYRTTAVTGGGYMSVASGLSQGFDQYTSWPERDRDRELKVNLDQFLDWLAANTERRFFALLHTYETHEPYQPRQPYFDRFYNGALKDRVEDLAWRPLAGDNPLDNRRVEFVWRQRPDDTPPSHDEMLKLVAAMYDSRVAYMDAQMERLFRRLRELGLEDRTAVVFTSDHGEALGEHGGLQGHQDPYDHTLLVPLVIAAPGLDAAGRTVHTQVRSVDIAPTLSDLTGLQPLEGIDGQSLVPLIRGEKSQHDPEAWSYVGKANWGIVLRRGNELKYVYNDAPWAGLRAREFLYRLEEDPTELNDTAESAREVDPLRNRVLKRMSTVPAFRIRLSSTAGERLRGRLNGELVQPRKLKTVNMPCDCLQWIPQNTVAFEVPPGTSYTLLFHEAPPGGTLTVEELSLEGRPEIGAANGIQIDLQELEGARTLSLVGGDWGLQDGYRTGQTPSLTFWRSGDIGVGRSDPSANDPLLTDQLRALGYVD